jgi:hypothetical protein
MIHKVEIPPQFDHCIWCGKPFAIRGFRPRLGEVERSAEHIIPQNLFGRIWTEDVCKICNGTMGRLVDPKLLKDHGIVSAALSAGYKPDEILPQFKLAGIAPDGRPFEYHVKNGVWKVAP